MNHLGNLVWGMQLGEYLEEILVTAILMKRKSKWQQFVKKEIKVMTILKEVSLVAAILTDTVFKGKDTTLGE